MTWILETERLRLRQFVVEDATDMFRLNLDPEVIKYTGDPPFESIVEARAFIEAYDHYDKYGFGRWACIKKEDNSYIGWCGLRWNELEEIDLGFRFFRKEWNQGYATEAAIACTDFGFDRLKLTQIIGRTHPKNIGSIRVLMKIGMTYWKTGTCGQEQGFLYYRKMNSSSRTENF